MAHTIAIINQKGGVAKTISTAHLAVALSKLKKNILCIDLDPQANLSQILGNIGEGEKPATTIYDALQKDSTQSIHLTYRDTKHDNVKLCYGSLRMSTFELDIQGNLDPSRVLTNKIDQGCHDDFDFILLDCPPSLSAITTNALCASDFFIIPIAAGDSLALEGVEQLTTVVNSVRSAVNEKLMLLGVVLTKYDGRLNIAKAIAEEATRVFGTASMFKARISQGTLLEQATHQRKTVYEVDTRAPAAKDHTKLAKEIITRAEFYSSIASDENTPDEATDEGTPEEEPNISIVA